MKHFRLSAGRCSTLQIRTFDWTKQAKRSASDALMATPLTSSFSLHASMSASSPTTSTTADSVHIDTLISYHDRTKHFFNRYADGPHGLDWANQPDPFRRYVGSPVVPLDHFPSPTTSLFNNYPYAHAFSGCLDAVSLSKATLSQLLHHSFALSAWKTSGFSTWALRINPSSGNLHPTEAYVVSGAIEGISEVPFVAHYAPKQHSLEIRCELPSDFWMEMSRGFPEDVLFLGLTSIHWREAWKYGERAFRYCNHDVGHALGAISVAVAGMGWDSFLLDGWGSEDLDYLLGVHGRKSIPPGSGKKGSYPELEQEHADCLVACFPRLSNVMKSSDRLSKDDLNVVVPSKVLLQLVSEKMRHMIWNGKPNRLSKDHMWWQVIDKAAEASKKPTTPAQVVAKPWPLQTGMDVYKPYTLWQVVTKRRSAVNMNPNQTLSFDAFYQMLLKTLPSGPNAEIQGSNIQVPFRILPWNAEVHMAIFVHRVIGLPKGLYMLIRNSEHEERLRKSLREDFVWERPPKCPESLHLYRLAEGDCERVAMQVSCFQEIAGYGCFSLGMIAHFDTIKGKGAWMYPRLFWESGVLGQLLYLEAHAVGISATGIGCYFDDTVHEILGLKGREFQSLYHFTVGSAVEDKRITGLPPYPPPE
ncbi:hypothetical protein KP509_20G080100 [Ceratopteris richardii]|uniref:Nitroreductase domain-containing protein n=1 Tax=Ceratopteris richardii TaxID=49495 RepID=A0A8T2SIT5_CERRI|nr:hypothetical protein KP509_20G080100 [Ceratopteris richardii]KAH7332288.1 hypothetical protein KP509_20G080100 [Ceratopteris richardii]